MSVMTWQEKGDFLGRRKDPRSLWGGGCVGLGPERFAEQKRSPNELRK